MKKFLLFAGSYLLPVAAFAQVTVDPQYIRGALTTPILTFFNGTVIPLLVAIAVIFLVFSAFQFATSGGDEEKRKSARDRIVWGLVGIVLIFTIYGIVRLISFTFYSTGGTLNAPPGVALP